MKRAKAVLETPVQILPTVCRRGAELDSARRRLEWIKTRTVKRKHAAPDLPFLPFDAFTYVTLFIFGRELNP